MSEKTNKKLLLTILDGWGFSKKVEYNAVELGNTPTWDNLSSKNPSSYLTTHGEEVGLPEGQMGNSEVGHTNIGAGRIVYQDLPRINKAIKDGNLPQNEKILETITYLKESQKAIHIMGLLSNGGVHSHVDHYFYMAELFAKAGVDVKLHVFTDGRDTPPSSAIAYNEAIETLLQKYPNITLATISGRYYAMDRDKRWDRITLAYNAIVSADAKVEINFKEAITNSYNENITDEFIMPVIIKDYKGIQDGDCIFMINYRSDRARQILEALVNPCFDEFERNITICFGSKIGMVSYSDNLNKYMDTIFKPEELENTLGEWLSKQNLKQLRLAETEKYPHVTFFFSGGMEDKYDHEDRILVSSPKVATYDLQPEMSAFAITENLVESLNSQKYDFIVVNYANGDMVGHTGVLEAAIKATECVDKCLQQVEEAVIKNDYIWIVLADHGNCETMWDEINNVPHTQHTTNLVKAILINDKMGYQLVDGKLGDIAPSILQLMNVDKPIEMTGNIIIKK